MIFFSFKTSLQQGCNGDKANVIHCYSIIQVSFFQQHAIPFVSGHRAAAEGISVLSAFIIVASEQKPKATQCLHDM